MNHIFINDVVAKYLTDNVSESAINTFISILSYVEKYTNRVYLHSDDLELLINSSHEDFISALKELDKNGFVKLYDSPFVGIGLYINPFCYTPDNSWRQDFS